MYFRLVIMIILGGEISKRVFFIDICLKKKECIVYTIRKSTNYTITYTHACSVAPLCLILCDPMDCSPPGSTVHEILQARILKWVAISFPKQSQQKANSLK